MARGIGSRMRQASDEAELTPEQTRAADAGLKAMISVGRPFLDHVISELADAGFSDICLVIGPEHEQIRTYYDAVPHNRVSISYAIQAEPRGTADAVRAAHHFTGNDSFLVVNSDNFYPAAAVEQLQQAKGAATLGFEPETLVAQSNIPAQRVNAYALLTTDQDHHLTAIVEKPSAADREAIGSEVLVSMNCWLLTPAFYPAAAQIAPSPRGEYELADAVRAMVAAGETIEVFPVRAGSLDLANRDDIASVEAALADHEVRL